MSSMYSAYHPDSASGDATVWHGNLHFGAIIIVGLAIGLVTPPVGMCLNVASKICNMEIVAIFKAAIPFIICNVIVLVLSLSYLH